MALLRASSILCTPVYDDLFLCFACAPVLSPGNFCAHRRDDDAGHVKPLRIPRRPQWTTDMSKEELETNEMRSFLEWRSSIAKCARVQCTVASAVV